MSLSEPKGCKMLRPTRLSQIVDMLGIGAQEELHAGINLNAVKKHRSAPKHPVPLFRQSRPLEQKINKETFAYRLSMDSPAGARISQETFTTGSMYSLFPSTCTDIELVAPPPSFNQPELSHFNPRENTWGKAESDLLISQIGSWGTNGEPWKLSEEEHHNSVRGANRMEDYEQWQRNRAGHEKCKMGLFFKRMGRN